jgi:hypothetical protein
MCRQGLRKEREIVYNLESRLQKNKKYKKMPGNIR